MKTLNFNILQKFILVFCISLFTIGCSTDNIDEQPVENLDNIDQKLIQQEELMDNSENIRKLIGSFDFLLKKSISNPKLSDEDLGSLFIEESKKNGLRIVKIQQNQNNHPVFSKEYIYLSNSLQKTNNYDTKEEYRNSLTSLQRDVINSKMSIEEKQLLVDTIGFLVEFTDWMEALKDSNLIKFNSINKKDCDGWWSCWGSCVAATVGGALTGGVAGCAVGGAVGATAGAAIAGIPSAGIATPVGAGVGAVVGCVGVGIVGAIGGGLTAASSSCG